MKKETERENMRELTRAELEIMQILCETAGFGNVE